MSGDAASPGTQDARHRPSIDPVRVPSYRGAAPSSASSAADSEKCSALLNAKGLPNATAVITAATLNAPSGPQPAPNPLARPTPALPEHCEALGTLNERTGANGQKYAIHFHLRLPNRWNGRFFFEGGGGSNGNLGAAFGVLQGQQPTVALALGYAVVSQDSGHDNRTNDDPARGGTTTFGLDPQARIDFGYNSYQQVTLTAKALISAFYGRAPQKVGLRRLFGGGREGMMVSQPFPELFDGVLACAPGFRLPRAAVAEAWDSQAFASVYRARPTSSTRTVSRCSTRHSPTRISRWCPARCCPRVMRSMAPLTVWFRASPAARLPSSSQLLATMCTGEKTASCLTETQITALKMVFGGARTSAGVQITEAGRRDAESVGRLALPLCTIRAGGPGSSARTPRRRNSALNLTLGASSLPHIFVMPPVPTAATGGPPAYSFAFQMDDAMRLLTNRTDTYR